MSDLRVPLTVRLYPADKEFFTAETSVAGLEAGTAARQIIELFTRHMRETGAGYIDALTTINTALKPKVRVPAGRAP